MSALQASRFSGNIQDVAKLSGPGDTSSPYTSKTRARDGRIYIFFAREMLFGSSTLLQRRADSSAIFRRRIFMIPADLEDPKSRVAKL